jgi:hypothetical protein
MKPGSSSAKEQSESVEQADLPAASWGVVIEAPQTGKYCAKP